MFLDPPTSSVFCSAHNNGRPVLPVWLEVCSPLIDFLTDFIWHLNKLKQVPLYSHCPSICSSSSFSSMESQGSQSFCWTKKEDLILFDSRPKASLTISLICAEMMNQTAHTNTVVASMEILSITSCCRHRHFSRPDHTALTWEGNYLVCEQQ